MALGLPERASTALPEQAFKAKDQASKHELPPVKLASVLLDPAPKSQFDATTSRAWFPSPDASELELDGLTEITILENEAQMTLQAFIEAPDWKEKALYVLNSKDIISRFRRYYEDGGSDPLYNVMAFRYPEGFLKEKDIQAKLMALVGEHQGERMAFFFRDGKLDWEAYVQLKDQSLEKFCSTISGKPSKFRVRMKIDREKEKPELLISNLVPGNVWTIGLPNAIGFNHPLAASLFQSDRDRTGIISLAWEQKNGGYRIVLQKILAWDFLYNSHHTGSN